MDIYLFIVVDKDKTTFNDIHFADTTQNIFLYFYLIQSLNGKKKKLSQLSI